MPLYIDCRGRIIERRNRWIEHPRASSSGMKAPRAAVGRTYSRRVGVRRRELCQAQPHRVSSPQGDIGSSAKGAAIACRSRGPTLQLEDHGHGLLPWRSVRAASRDRAWPGAVFGAWSVGKIRSCRRCWSRTWHHASQGRWPLAAQQGAWTHRTPAPSPAGWPLAGPGSAAARRWSPY
jgi:hypothetical protein